MSEKSDSRQGVDRPVSLAPLDIKKALSGLLGIPNPDATKPKRKKAPPTPDKE